jgi:hypothetical protein
MGDSHCGIYCAAVVSGSELVSRYKGIKVDIRKEASHDDLLQEFPNAIQEADGPEGFWGRVVQFVGFGDDDNVGIMPWMEP